MEKIGIIVLAYAKRAKEPNPVNVELARNANKLVRKLRRDGRKVFVAAQRETAGSLEAPAAIVITQQTAATNVDRRGRRYLDSQDVINEAWTLFAREGITTVAVVAHPFLYKPIVEHQLKKLGYTVIPHTIEDVGFDNSPLNLQWWTKGPIRFVLYLAIQVIGKVTKQNFHGIGEKER